MSPLPAVASGAGFLDPELCCESAQCGSDQVRRDLAVLMCRGQEDVSCAQHNEVGENEHDEQRDSGEDDDEQKIRAFGIDLIAFRRWQV